jgi:hypothetical protein
MDLLDEDLVTWHRHVRFSNDGLPGSGQSKLREGIDERIRFFLGEQQYRPA